ncbi:hypothetical protein J437_LFUL012142 [Ladona fulva]|uniref:Ubiquinone biosynthesis protein COQ4 homolog, mitochondrial n=1 Tax=Ladona fulva TaxID=123851 RepID=A0A8K0KD30_LADFU|nr:hypothetical protein J437_LFUL012142 [Ladona fulva]
MAARQTLPFAKRCGCARILTSRFVPKHVCYNIQRYLCARVNENTEAELHLGSSKTRERYDELAAFHTPTSALQKVLLAVGSASISLLDPTRPEMIAVLGETTGHTALKYIHNVMAHDKEGLEILSERPRINSRTVDLEALSKMPEGTLGKVYTDFLKTYKITPDSRQTVQFVDDMELAYVMQRKGRECEVAVKWVEGIQTRLPMCIGGALFGPLRYGPKYRQKYVKYYLPWAVKTGFEAKFLMNVFYEKRWEQSVSELLEELNIKPLKLEP